MPTYAIVIIHKVKDEAKFSDYRKVAAEALAKHGGSILAPPSSPIKLDGDDAVPSSIVMLSFLSKAAAENWRKDPELQAVHALRNAGIDATIYAF